MDKIERAIEYIDGVINNYGYEQRQILVDEAHAIKNALEKQIPKKPKHDDYWNVKVCECGQQAVRGIRYCPWCGQKFNWE